MEHQYNRSYSRFTATKHKNVKTEIMQPKERCSIFTRGVANHLVTYLQFLIRPIVCFLADRAFALPLNSFVEVTVRTVRHMNLEAKVVGKCLLLLCY